MNLHRSQSIYCLPFVILVFILANPFSLTEARCSRLPSGRCWVNCMGEVFNIICNNVTSNMVQSDIKVFANTMQRLRLYIWSSPLIRQLSADVFSSVASQLLLVDLQDVVSLEVFPEVQNLVNLRRLNIWNSPKLCELAFELLPQSIWKIALNKVCVGYFENDFFEVPSLPNLQIFVLSNVTIKGWNPDFLGVFPNLRELEISNSTFDLSNERSFNPFFPKINSSLTSLKLLSNGFLAQSESKSRQLVDGLLRQINLAPGATVDLSYSDLKFDSSTIEELLNFRFSKSLSLRGNSLAAVSKRDMTLLFEKFSQLEQLDLGQAKIIPIPGMFSGLVKLKVLKLDKNQLQSLQKTDMFDGCYAADLSHLDLSYNDLWFLPTNGTLFDLAPQVEYLNLQGNRLQVFLSPEEADRPSLLEVFSNVTTLILSRNNLTSFYGNHLRHMKNLQILDLNCNLLRQIKKEFFIGLPGNLSKLNLSMCIQPPALAPYLELDAFSTLPAIKVLCLSRSSYKKWIFAILLKLSSAARQSLEELYLDDNQISFIKQDTITSLPNLRLLSINRNSLQSVAPGIFASLPELQNLQLSGNKINSFDVRAFSGLNNQLQKLRHLDVSGNGLAGIVTGSFDELPQLSSLMLGWNDVDVHQIFRDGGKELTYLGIQDYNRSCLKPELFEQLPKLRWVLPDVYNIILTSPDLPLPSDEKRLNTLVKVCITGWDNPDHETYPGLRDFVSVTIHDTDEGTGVQYPIVAAFFPLHYCPEDDYVNQLKNILCTKPEAPMQI